MPELDHGLLIKGIEHSFHLAPHEVSQAMIDRYINRVKKSETKVSTDTPESIALLKLIEKYLYFFEPNYVQSLLDCEIYVVPFPVCIAYSQKIRDRHIIVIGNGLVNLISSTICWAYFIKDIPEEFDNIFPFDKIPTISVQSATAVYSFMLIYRYYCYGEDLPHFQPLLEENFHARYFHNVSGSMIFILFHELGHILLGHVSDEEPRPMNIKLLLDQELSMDQLKEFEADSFVISCLKSEFYKLSEPWMQSALNFHSFIESMLTIKSNEHPLTLNRLQAVHNVLEKLTSGSIEKNNIVDINNHLKNQAEFFQNLENYNQILKERNQNLFPSAITREQIIVALKVLNTYLEPASLNLTEVFNNTPLNWIDDLKLAEKN